MRWYSVRVLIRCSVAGDPKKSSLYEDRVLLVKAKEHKTAEKKAKKLVKTVTYKNAFGKQVTWKLQKVFESVDLFDKNMKDGTQVYWRFFRSSDPIKRLKRDGVMNGIR